MQKVSDSNLSQLQKCCWYPGCLQIGLATLSEPQTQFEIPLSSISVYMYRVIVRIDWCMMSTACLVFCVSEALNHPWLLFTKCYGCQTFKLIHISKCVCLKVSVCSCDITGFLYVPAITSNCFPTPEQCQHFQIHIYTNGYSTVSFSSLKSKVVSQEISALLWNAERLL